MIDLQDAGVGVQAAHHRADQGAVRLRDVACLVDHHHVGELDLLHQQVDQGAGILGARGLAALAQEGGRAVILQQVHGVDHRHHRVEAGEIRERAAGLVAEREGRGDRQWLGDAGALDQQVVEPPRLGQAADLVQQVVPQGAADAAVGHLHQRLVGPGEVGAAGPHEVGVDVHRAHVVDDHGDPAAVAIVEHMVEQGRHAGSQESGQHGDGKAGIALGHTQKNVITFQIQARPEPGTRG